jgi:hypothetical protein
MSFGSTLVRARFAESDAPDPRRARISNWTRVKSSTETIAGCAGSRERTILDCADRRNRTTWPAATSSGSSSSSTFCQRP